MTRTRNLVAAAVALLAIGATTLSATATSASGVDGLRHRAHRWLGLHHGAHSARFAGPARQPCVTKQVRPDGTVVFVDRCAQESAVRRRHRLGHPF